MRWIRPADSVKKLACDRHRRRGRVEEQVERLEARAGRALGEEPPLERARRAQRGVPADPRRPRRRAHRPPVHRPLGDDASVSTTTLKSWPASSGISLAASVNRRPAGMVYARRTSPPLASRIGDVGRDRSSGGGCRTGRSCRTARRRATLPRTSTRGELLGGALAGAHLEVRPEVHGPLDVDVRSRRLRLEDRRERAGADLGAELSVSRPRAGTTYLLHDERHRRPRRTRGRRVRRSSCSGSDRTCGTRLAWAVPPLPRRTSCPSVSSRRSARCPRAAAVAAEAAGGEVAGAAARRPP